MDDGFEAFAVEKIELSVGDEAGDGKDGVFFTVKTGHLLVDPVSQY